MKSNVSNYPGVALAVYKDACAKCTADVSSLRDIDYILSRIKHEGLSFLTITLPSFSRDFERSLANGFVDSKSFRSFRKIRAIPAFLQGMLSQVFDLETGRIYDDKTRIASNDVPTIIDSVRQICCTFKKVEIECTPERNALAFESFAAIEQSLEMFTLPREDSEVFTLVSSMLWGSVLSTIVLSDLTPRHGPGATSDAKSSNGRYIWDNWHDRLETYFPILGNGYSVSAYDDRCLQRVSFVPADTEPPVRVITVPKTLKSPRIIAIEPSCMQYTQQGIRGALYDAIESRWMLSGQVNFSDQAINQSLAISGSSTGLLATIDLSDASDRVPRDLALSMFDSNPDLRDAIDACRSTTAKLPFGVIPLKKFASMGSALCFPVEAMYFYTICVVALLRTQNLSVTYPHVRYVGRQVHVYGDDIIVPSAYAVAVSDYLHKYNCKVNTNKTFFTGKFRESCGVDAYDGKLVTPVYVRKQFPRNRQQVPELISCISTANQFYLKGYWNTSQLLFKIVEKHLGSLPYVGPKSQVLGRVSFLGYNSVERWNKKLHRFEVKAWFPRPVYRTDKLVGHGALAKSLLRLGVSKNNSLPMDPQNLERSARHHAVALKRGWFPPT